MQSMVPPSPPLACRAISPWILTGRFAAREQQVADNGNLWEKIVQVAVAMESAITKEEIFRATTQELLKLGYSCAILGVTDDDQHICVKHVTCSSGVLDASEMTRQLLAFSRKQVIAPGPSTRGSSSSACTPCWSG